MTEESKNTSVLIKILLGIVTTLVMVVLLLLGFRITGIKIGWFDLVPPATQDNNPSTSFPLAGSWSGTIKSPDGSFSTELNLMFDSSCNANEVCGTYDAYQLPCSGTLTLVKQEGSSYVFLETKTKGADWCGFCYEHIQKQSGNSISYGCSGTGLSKDIQSTGILSKP